MEFFSFPHKTRDARTRKLWVEKVRRGGDGDNFTVTKHTRICSKHFVDRMPSTDNPYPTLFGYNNFKKPKRVRETCTSTGAPHPTPADGQADATGTSGEVPATATAVTTSTTTREDPTLSQRAATGSTTRSVLCVPEACLPPVGTEIEIDSRVTSKPKKNMSGEEEFISFYNVTHQQNDDITFIY